MINRKLTSIVLFLMVIITGCSSNPNNDENATARIFGNNFVNGIDIASISYVVKNI